MSGDKKRKEQTPADKVKLIANALDRFQEAHYWIHTLEENYHSSDLFRWHLNAYLKALNEVVKLIQMDMQNEPGFTNWFEPHSARIKSDPLLSVLTKHRNFIVHKGTLALNSTGTIGVTKGRGIKFGLNLPVEPNQDSDDAMDDFVWRLAKAGDFFGFLANDDDTMPCVYRKWLLPQFEDEVIELCAKAWIRLGETLSDVLEWLGQKRPQLALNCRHTSQQVQFKLYNRQVLRRRLREYRAADGFEMSEGASDVEDLSED